VDIINKFKSVFEKEPGQYTLDKVLITGFPHSGTTILRAILENIDCVYAHPWESNIASAAICKNALKSGASHVVVKWPNINESFFDSNHDVYGDYKKIFIIRNPFYTYSSLNKSKTADSPGVRMDDWQKTAQYWLSVNEEARDDVICIRYEDLFARGYEGTQRVISGLGIKEYDPSVYEENEKYSHQIEDMTGEITIHSTARLNDHSKFRRWQVHQEFKCANEPSGLYLSWEQINKISSMLETSVLGYTGDVMCQLLKPTK
jgi:hypothetical protein